MEEKEFLEKIEYTVNKSFRFKSPHEIDKEAQEKIIFCGLSLAEKITKINEIINLIKCAGPTDITMTVLNKYFNH